MARCGLAKEAAWALLFDFRPGRRYVGPELVRRTECEAVEVEVTVP